jgi:hypothetical protein
MSWVGYGRVVEDKGGGRGRNLRGSLLVIRKFKRVEADVLSLSASLSCLLS